MVRVALAVPPVTVWKFPLPSSKLAVILPVTLFLVPPLFGVTFTEKEQEVDAGRFIESRIRPLPGLADRKSTRLNSSHVRISYAVFCLNKKNNSIYPFYYQKKNQIKSKKHTQNQT